MMELSRHPTTYPTRYQQIAAQLEQELRTQYRCGDYLPSEQQLAERYQVNRHTLRRAVDQLVERGWLQRRHGVGILVLMRPYDYPLHANTRFTGGRRCSSSTAVRCTSLSNNTSSRR